MGDDITQLMRSTHGNPELTIDPAMLKDYILHKLSDLLFLRGYSLQYVELPVPVHMQPTRSVNRLLSEQYSYNTADLRMEVPRLLSELNADQKIVFDAVITSVHSRRGELFFVYGHGGTGKTFLWRTITAVLRSEGRVVLTVASSGLSSLLLDGGVTAYSRFKIPLKLREGSTCEIKKNTNLAQLLRETSLIIWDEAPMSNKFCFEALDRSMRDILGDNNIASCEKTFGGVTVVLGGDFRQTLPVVPHGTRLETLSASITNSYLWPSCRLLRLTINMRLATTNAHLSDRQAIADFASWLLSIENGTAPATALYNCSEDDWIKIPDNLLVQHAGDKESAIIQAVYNDLQNRYHDDGYLRVRAIITPKNDAVNTLNEIILGHIPTEHRDYLSSDSIQGSEKIAEDIQTMYPTDILNTIATMTTPVSMITTTNPPIPVAVLTPTTDTENARLHGRAVRIWQAADARYGRVYNMAFLFIDHTGGKIQGLIPVPDYQRISNVFTEDNLCQITRFTLEGSTPDYQVVRHPYVLSLTTETVVTVLPPDLYDIPKNYFNFVSFTEIGVSITHLKAVMDIIGRIVGFSDVVTTNSTPQPSRVRGMYIADNEGRTIELALWGDYADQFNIIELFELSKQRPIIIAFNNAQIKYWRGIYGLKTYSGTRFYMEPSIKEIADYLALTPYDGIPITLHATAHTYNIHIVTPHRADPIKVTMAQLNGLYLDNYNENHYLCAGVIMSINNRFDWYYESCPDCRRKLGRNGGQLWCDHCKTRKMNSIPWYKIRVQAVDQTGDAQFVLLGKLGEEAVGMTAQAVVALQQQDRNRTPAPLMEIIGKKFLFTFAGKQRVPYQSNRIYTVVSIAAVPPEQLQLLPQPILHIEAASMFAAASSAETGGGEPHTPPHPAIVIDHSVMEQPSEDGPTPHLAGPADTRGKRPLKDEEQMVQPATKTARRSLKFNEPAEGVLQSVAGQVLPDKENNPSA
ncbi:hypothetical protein LUZ62_065993 [Rhynchospora pubera]|uniref:ATP-dependent DNA helicase n=1 Tax=Rhynchospora pubera TaxID=906938 RepID=A0AAV8ETY2_9POAL|nr:hypothetical protein LUZ62_065993 [Rhynchospora pubera]